jgi:hypothetical protein
MIGEQFDRGDEICGAVVNVRARQEKVSVWTKNASNEAAQVTFLKQINPPAFIIILSLLFVPICFFSAAVEHWETVEGVSRLQ